MNNCLVTKLKSSVNNESLSKLNVLTIKTKASDAPTINSQWICIGASENGSVSVNSPSVGLYQYGISGALTPYPINIQANTRHESHFENKDGIIEVDDKYNLNEIVVGENGTIRIKEIYGIPGTIKRLILRNIEEEEVDATKLSKALDISRLNVIEFIMSNTLIVNRLSKNTLEEFKAITDINPSFCSLFDSISLDDIANNVSVIFLSISIIKAGNLSSLAKLVNLTRIKFSDKEQNTGDIMDFINPWIQAGRTSGKINLMWLLGQKKITLNGQPITYPEGVSNVNAYLNWTSDGTVTFTAS